MDAYDSFLHLSVAAPVQAFPAFKELGRVGLHGISKMPNG